MQIPTSLQLLLFSLTFSYLISVTQHDLEIDLTAFCRCQYFGIFFSPCVMQTDRGSRVCTVTIDFPRSTGSLECRTTSTRRILISRWLSCSQSHTHTPFPSPASWKPQLDEMVSDPAKSRVWGNARYRPRRRLHCPKAGILSAKMAILPEILSRSASKPSQCRLPVMKSRSISLQPAWPVRGALVRGSRCTAAGSLHPSTRSALPFDFRVYQHQNTALHLHLYIS